MDQNQGDSPKPTAREAREARLAAALRVNLRRRKAAAADEPGDRPNDRPGDGESDGAVDRPDRD